MASPHRDELIYLPRNPRPHKAYGFSPVEQIVMTVNIGLRRQAMQLQHFTEGNVPPGLLNAPRVGAPNRSVNSRNGSTDLRREYRPRTRLVWVRAAPNTKPSTKRRTRMISTSGWRGSSVTRSPFRRPPSRPGQPGNGGNSSGSRPRGRLAPLSGWVKRLVDGVIQNLMGHTDLEFAWINSGRLTRKTKRQSSVAMSRTESTRSMKRGTCSGSILW